MQILILGFQQSGATILQRLLVVHPHIRRMFFEENLLYKHETKEDLIESIDTKFDTYVDNWGERISFYKASVGVDPVSYCRKWNQYFGGSARIIHIIRHPLDIAYMMVKRTKTKDKFSESLQIYKDRMRIIVPKICNMKNAMTITYEDMLLEPDTVLPEVFQFCQIDEEIDFRAALATRNTLKYTYSLDPGEVFIHRYKKRKIKTSVDLHSVLDVINKKLPDAGYE